MQKEHIDIVAVRNKISHLGKHAGYDQIYGVLQKNKQLIIHSSWRREHNALDIFLNLAALYPFRWYFGNRLFTLNNYRANIEAGNMALKLHADIVHFSHWEDSYSSPFHFLQKKTNIKVIATAHQPVSWWLQHVRKRDDMKRLDALIVLSQKEKLFFEKIIPGRVFYIGHGIDVDFFYPDKSAIAKQGKHCVFAGNWLRDIPLLIEIVDIITSKRKDIHFNIINQHVDNSKHPLYRLHQNKNVSLYKNLTDEELRGVYRKSSILVLPLKDSTANNGLMEAAACGLPAVVTDVGGIRDYTNSSFCDYMPPATNAAIFSERVITLLDDEFAVAERGQKARAFISEHFNWDTIARQTTELYKQVLQN